MAYMSQERKAQIAPKVKAVLKKYGIKGTLAVNHRSTLVLNIKAGEIDFIGNYNKVQQDKASGEPARIAEGYLQVNPYWFKEHFSGRALLCLSELFLEMNYGNHDRSDIQTDYFDCGWYVDVNIGKWNTKYEVI